MQCNIVASGESRVGLSSPVSAATARAAAAATAIRSAAAAPRRRGVRRLAAGRLRLRFTPRSGSGVHLPAVVPVRRRCIVRIAAAVHGRTGSSPRVVLVARTARTDRYARAARPAIAAVIDRHAGAVLVPAVAARIVRTSTGGTASRPVSRRRTPARAVIAPDHRTAIMSPVSSAPMRRVVARTPGWPPAPRRAPTP